MLSINENSRLSSLLGLGNGMEGQGGLPAALGAKDLIGQSHNVWV